MLTSKHQTRVITLWLLATILLLSACSSAPSTEVTPSLTAETEIATPIPAEPTPIPEPAVAVVNDEPISLAWFESEVARYLMAQDGVEQPVDELEAQEIVLKDLIDQVLLAQAAREVGAEISDQALQDRLEDLSASVDLTAWMAEWGYTEGELRFALRLQLLAADQRNRIAASVPQIAEHVELRQVFAYTEEGAGNALLSLNSGRDFTEVAFIYEPVTGGYLGWVPRGYLLIPALEEAAFNLEIGGYSEIIESEIGYHIVRVLDREDRPLSSDARLILQRQALYDWLAEQREVNTIEVLID